MSDEHRGDAPAAGAKQVFEVSGQLRVYLRSEMTPSGIVRPSLVPPGKANALMNGPGENDITVWGGVEAIDLEMSRRSRILEGGLHETQES
jgi:hypothetical protein